MNILAQLTALLCALPFSLACAATTPGTSTPRTTTTTIAPTRTTTTVAPTACMTCMASQVSFDKANGDPGRIDSSFRLEMPDPATGCLRLTAICTAQQGFFAFMEFNVNQGGPAENQNMGQVVEALLECMNGAWFYMGIRQVNSVQCTEAPL
ncbi:hypothetical protein ANCCEY_06673 [Ancylostoma ceylanicum]|uniref:C6 domain-containing protein n=1 Tax=Ancylostoma ceylanicum TaxID=53326 RepID=A0A0D6LQS4_9BILA|nr:hypothetical protein ANCCEY_06673 [Ancylostoma ceylanicum]